jgi:hypothetical protein
MAGAGYRNFTAGAVLTAAQVNTFLMEQSVMNFAGTAARGSALASVLSAGQMAHVGGGTVTVYDGSAWKQVYPSTAAGMTLITSGTLSGASVVLSSIPATYQDLRLVLRNVLPATNTAILYVRFNADSTANRYASDQIVSAGPLAFSAAQMETGGLSNSTSQTLMVFNVLDYANSATWKMYNADALFNDTTTTTQFKYRRFYGLYNQTAAISGMTLLMSSGNFTSGNYFLYGVG